MDAKLIVSQQPFKYHSAATFIEGDVAAVIQAAVKKEGHRGTLPKPPAQTEVYELQRNIYEEKIREFVSQCFYTDANTIRASIGTPDHQTRYALRKLRDQGEVVAFSHGPHQAVKYCAEKDLELVRQALGKIRML